MKRATIDLIDAGERKTVVFRNLGQIVQFAQKTNVVVEVAAGAGRAADPEQLGHLSGHLHAHAAIAAWGVRWFPHVPPSNRRAIGAWLPGG